MKIEKSFSIFFFHLCLIYKNRLEKTKKIAMAVSLSYTGNPVNVNTGNPVISYTGNPAT